MIFEMAGYFKLKANLAWHRQFIWDKDWAWEDSEPGDIGVQDEILIVLCTGHGFCLGRHGIRSASQYCHHIK